MGLERNGTPRRVVCELLLHELARTTHCNRLINCNSNVFGVWALFVVIVVILLASSCSSFFDVVVYLLLETALPIISQVGANRGSGRVAEVLPAPILAAAVFPALAAGRGRLLPPRRRWRDNFKLSA